MEIQVLKCGTIPVVKVGEFQPGHCYKVYGQTNYDEIYYCTSNNSPFRILYFNRQRSGPEVVSEEELARIRFEHIDSELLFSFTNEV